jgi:hypothetical protein
MHQSKAAGTAIEAHVLDDGRTWFGAHIVDSEAVKKIKANVYKGLSVGGRVKSRDEKTPTMITSLDLVEVSLVDRPANPECVLTMYKADGIEEQKPAEVSAVDALAEMLNKAEITPEALLDIAKREVSDKERKRLAGKGQAMPDGSYPIANESDLRNAIQAYGRAKNPEAVKRHITRRARALGRTDLLPADWSGSTKDKGKAKTDAKMDIVKYEGEEICDAGMAIQALSWIQQLLDKESDEPGEPPDQVPSLQAAVQALKDFIASEIMEDNSDEGDMEDEGVTEMAAKPQDVTKTDDSLAKLTAQFEKLQTQFEILIDDRNKIFDERETLAKRVNELLALPQPPKVALKAVAKGQEIEPINQAPEVPPTIGYDGKIDETATLIKKIHATGGTRIFR